MFKTVMATIGTVVATAAVGVTGYYFYKEHEDEGSGTEFLVDVLEKAIDWLEDKAEG